MRDNGNRRSTDPIIIEMAGNIGKIAGTLDAVHAKVEKIDDKFDHHEDRIGALEDNQKKLIWGAGGVAATISGFAWLMGFIR